MTVITTLETDRDALAERLVDASMGALELYGVYLGLRLGLYEALAGGGEQTPAELAARSGIHPRYAREWLEQQAVAGILTAIGDDEERRFLLPAAHREVLTDADSLYYVAPLALLLAGIGRVLPEVVEAYRTGAGVPYAAYGADLRNGQAAMNRPAFTHELVNTWLPTLPEVHARLGRTPPAHVADIGCGAGWSAIAIARAYPHARVDGFDLDEASVADARANAEAAGVSDRARFAVRDATEVTGGPYDLVCVFEALHDMARPVEALAAIRNLLAPDGSLLVVDERVAERFTAPGDSVERMMYGWSITHCLPAAMVEQPSAATGTVLRPDLLRGYATDAGLTRVEILPVHNDFFRLYRLRP